jgi:uncharacterized protein YigA (DUF484 family)
MSQQHKLDQIAAQPLPEEEIAAYLTENPDFFERHGKVLVNLRLPHATTGATISLVERQISMLRQKNDQLQRNLKNFVNVAKHNDVLAEKIHRLALAFMSVHGIGERIERLETSLREDFMAQRAALVLFEAPTNVKLPSGFVVVHKRDDEALKPFAAFINARKTRCGPLRERQKQLLFGVDDEALGSAAMVPLGGGGKIGFLVIGNRDRNYFNPGERTDFLDRMGDLVAAALDSGLTPSG